jgi:predicted transcriptional regulator
MWLWPLDESQQTLVIAILGFIGAFLLTHYFLSLRSRTAIMSDSNSYDDELIESLLSQYSAKFVAITKIIESINLRLELLERVLPLEQRKLAARSEVETSKSVYTSSNSSLLPKVNSDNHDDRTHDDSDIDLKSDVTKSYHQLHDIHDTTDMTRFVLRVLSERPMNTIEIQSKISRTREHTSRFMKRLFLEGLVSREMNTKPFVYTLTDEGRKQLKVSHSDV